MYATEGWWCYAVVFKDTRFGEYRLELSGNREENFSNYAQKSRKSSGGRWEGERRGEGQLAAAESSTHFRLISSQKNLTPTFF